MPGADGKPGSILAPPKVNGSETKTSQHAPKAKCLKHVVLVNDGVAGANTTVEFRTPLQRVTAVFDDEDWTKVIMLMMTSFRLTPPLIIMVTQGQLE